MPKILNLTDSIPVEEIILHRGEHGLGFNIRGGTDIPHFKDLDTGIFVTRLKEAGAAFKDKRLKEGDKIVSVNGQDIRSVTHNEAVQIFITAGETVNMKVQHGAEAFVMKKIEDSKNGGAGAALVGGGLLVILMGAAAAAGFYVMQNK